MSPTQQKRAAGRHEQPSRCRPCPGSLGPCHREHAVILLLCFLINVQSASSISCLGLLLVEFMEYYSASRAAVAWVAGAHMGVSAIVGPLLGMLLKRFGSRLVGVATALLSAVGLVMAAFINNLSSLYVTFGLMAGVGPCSYYAIANSTVQHYFDKRRSLACAFVLTAFSVGGFAWPPICRLLIDHYSWQGSLLFIAAFHVQLVLVFFILGLPRFSQGRAGRPRTVTAQRQQDMDNWQEDSEQEAVFSMGAPSLAPAENGAAKSHHPNSDCHTKLMPSDAVKLPGEAETECSLVSCCHSFLTSWAPRTCIYSLGVCMGMILHAGVLVYTPVRCWQLGLSKQQAALLVSLINAAGGFCRIPSGWLGDLKCVNRGLLLATAVIVCGVLSGLSYLLSTFAMLAIFSVVYGSIIAAYLGLQTVVLSDIAGMAHLSVAMGILLGGHGTSNLVLHLIAGALMDHTGSANSVFIVIGIVAISGGSLVILATILSVCSKRRQRRPPRTETSVEETPLNGIS